MDTLANHVLIVDDEPILQKVLERYLRDQGLRVGCAADGRTLDAYLRAHPNPPVDLIVLDLVMPGEDGLAITRRLRAAGNQVPIIMLSSHGQDTDRIIGLEVGVDDYLPKPANPRELLARIRAVLRRHGRTLGANQDSQASGVGFGPFVFDLEARRLTRNGEEVALTTGEFTLLKIFVENPGRELSRDNLMEILKGYEHTPFDRTIDVRVLRLRQKIEDDPKKPQFIKTVWGKGYIFSPAKNTER